MQGRELFKVIVGAVRTSLERLMVDNGMQPEDIDWIIPHQANSRIIDKSVKMLGFPKERVIMTLAKHANTSSASIPLALDDAVCKGIVQKGQTIILEAFGAGLTWGGILLRYK
jgi:3-oxoacyl-[acyl-carrier-protein] synthase-3